MVNGFYVCRGQSFRKFSHQWASRTRCSNFEIFGLRAPNRLNGCKRWNFAWGVVCRKFYDCFKHVQLQTFGSARTLLGK